MCLKICVLIVLTQVCVTVVYVLIKASTIDSCEIAVDHVANITRPLESVNVLFYGLSTDATLVSTVL